MKILLLICGLLFSINSITLAQPDTSSLADKLAGTWVLYKDSTAEGVFPITPEETDTIHFLTNGSYTRKYSGTIENGRWHYSTAENGFILDQRIREYHWEGQKQSYKMPMEIFIENNKINNDEFIDTMVADRQVNNEFIIYYRYYNRIK